MNTLVWAYGTQFCVRLVLQATQQDSAIGLQKYQYLYVMITVLVWFTGPKTILAYDVLFYKSAGELHSNSRLLGITAP
jgi:hypothetical protein